MPVCPHAPHSRSRNTPLASIDFLFSSKPRAGPSHSDRRHGIERDRRDRQSMGAISVDRYSVSYTYFNYFIIIHYCFEL